jgi:hypothetical protein
VTNKIVLRTVEEFMAGYTPTYKPIYSRFLGKSQQYASEVAKRDFRRVQAVGDIRAKHITPKDTEIRQVSVMEGKKSFKAYFLANQFVLSDMQDRQGVEDVLAQVLDEHQKQMDDLLLLGEGTSGSDVINNGLFWSGDPNYTLETSTEVKKGSAADYLVSLFQKVSATAAKADQVAGRKLVVFYGDLIKPLAKGLFSTAVRPFASVLAESLGQEYDIAYLPDATTPSGTNGWILANLDQIKLHYSALPGLLDQGNNAEKMYLWFNFLMGSTMLEVLANDGIIRQPATLEA